MLHCWLPKEDGYTLINESGDIVWRIIDLEKQIYVGSIKRARSPSGWFRLHVHKKRGERESA